MSAPPSVTRPASGRSNPAMIRSVVVLPEPDGPSSVKNSPSPTLRSTSSTATTSPYVFRIPSADTSAAKETLEDVEAALELCVSDREWDQDPDHVPVDAARQEHQPLFARLLRDARRLLAVLLRQLDRDHRAETAYLGARRRHRRQPLVHPGSDGLRPGARRFERVEDRDRSGARERIAAEG